MAPICQCSFKINKVLGILEELEIAVDIAFSNAFSKIRTLLDEGEGHPMPSPSHPQSSSLSSSVHPVNQSTIKVLSPSDFLSSQSQSCPQFQSQQFQSDPIKAVRQLDHSDQSEQSNQSDQSDQSDHSDPIRPSHTSHNNQVLSPLLFLSPIRPSLSSIPHSSVTSSNETKQKIIETYPPSIQLPQTQTPLPALHHPF